MILSDKIVCGPPEPVVPAHLSFSKYLLHNVMNIDKNVIAIINGETGDSITYGELLDRSVKTAIGLHQLGLKKGDIVGFCSENRFDYMITGFAVLFNGAVIANLNISYSSDEMKHVLNISKPGYLFCTPHTWKTHQEVFRNTKFIKTFFLPDVIPNGMRNGISLLDYLSINVDISKFDPIDVNGLEDLVAINCSSGTTGLPKGVMITHLNLLYTAHIIINKISMAKLDLQRVLTVVPWFHAYGFCSTLSYLSFGRTLIYLSKFTPDGYLKCIHSFKPNLLLTVPAIVVFLAKSPLIDKYDLSSVKQIGCGAAPLSVDIINEVKKRMPNVINIYQGYGMTETTIGVIRDNVDTELIKAGSIGKLVPGIRAKVVDIDSRKLLGPYERGELCFKGRVLMKGYMGKVKETEQAFDNEGYLLTGDVGYYDEDGFFYIVDRIKELIKYKGNQVPPAEVESVILEHSSVLDCGVVGKPDLYAGELPTAFVVLRPNSKVNEKEIVEHVASKLSKSKQLHGGVIFLNEIPKNPSGKILRRVLKQKLKTMMNSNL